jgi:hypothetical protein
LGFIIGKSLSEIKWILFIVKRRVNTRKFNRFIWMSNFYLLNLKINKKNQLRCFLEKTKIIIGKRLFNVRSITRGKLLRI